MNENYISALQTFLKNDTEVQVIVWDRIGFLRMAEWIAKPCIVFSEQSRKPEDFSNPDYRAWVDMFPVLIDIVVEYNDSIVGRNLRHLLRKKLGSFSGALSEDWSWEIVFQEFLAPDYNSDTDWVLRWWLYLFKSSYNDNSDN